MSGSWVKREDVLRLLNEKWLAHITPPARATIDELKVRVERLPSSVPGVADSQLRAALEDLVRLKDGPRDEVYRAAKDSAWARARAALKDLEPSPEAVTVCEKCGYAKLCASCDRCGWPPSPSPGVEANPSLAQPLVSDEAGTLPGVGAGDRTCCPECFGTGDGFNDSPCGPCGGSGTVPEAEGEAEERSGTTKEQRQAAIKKASEMVRSGNLVVRRAGEPEATPSPSEDPSDELVEAVAAVIFDALGNVHTAPYERTDETERPFWRGVARAVIPVVRAEYEAEIERLKARLGAEAGSWAGEKIRADAAEAELEQAKGSVGNKTGVTSGVVPDRNNELRADAYELKWSRTFDRALEAEAEIERLRAEKVIEAVTGEEAIEAFMEMREIGGQCGPTHRCGGGCRSALFHRHKIGMLSAVEAARKGTDA